jgi:hypothetical protein
MKNDARRDPIMFVRCASIVGFFFFGQESNVHDDHIATIVFMVVWHSQRGGGRCIRHKYQGVDVKKEVHHFQAIS